MLRNASSDSPSDTPTPTPEQYAELQRKYDSLNTEYMEISRELRDVYKDTNKEIKELRQQLDDEREAKRAAEARITHLETLLAIQKKSGERPAPSRDSNPHSVSPSNNP